MSNIGSIFNCIPDVPNCAPFQDPAVDSTLQESTLSLFLERINNVKQISCSKQSSKFSKVTEIDASTDVGLPPSIFEKSTPMLERFLRTANYDLEMAYTKWLDWTTFRHTHECDSITDDDIKHEVALGLAQWRGRDKHGRPCLVITGRLLNAGDHANYKVTVKSFRQFLIKTVEDGIKLANQEMKDEICIIYDRRGLDFNHIDPNLFRGCNEVIDKLKEFYGNRVGLLYVLYTNWLFWTMYHIFIKPMLIILRSSHKVFVADSVDDLLVYFDDDQLLLVSPEPDQVDAIENVVSNVSSSSDQESKITEEASSKAGVDYSLSTGGYVPPTISALSTVINESESNTINR